MSAPKRTSKNSRQKPRNPCIEDLLARLEQAEATIHAIYSGEVDAVVVNGPRGPQVYTLEGADHPYRVLVEQMHEGTVTLDRDSVILYTNRQFAAMIGLAVDGVTGSRFDRFLTGTGSSAFAGLIDAAVARGHSCGEFELAGSPGNVIPARISLTMLDDVAGMQTMCLVANDLREQRRNEAILKEEQLSRLILDQAGEAIVVMEPLGTIMRCSQSATSLAGGTILGRHFDEAFSLVASGTPLDAAGIFRAARERRTVHGMEANLVRSNGRCPVLLSASAVWSENNELLGSVVTMTDITQRKRIEEAMARQAEELTRANSDLRQFAHSASHDLREPLRQLAVFNELLQKKYQDRLGPDGAGLIQHSVDSARHMEGLLQGLLEYTQAADAVQSTTGSCDANEVVEKTLATFEAQIAESRARIDCDQLPLLSVHQVHLTQLFQNLIGNALKYRGEAAPHIRIAAEPLDGMWMISVADNGIGIARDYQDKVFVLFQRLHGRGKYSGSGIGLAICQKIVQRYGGRIWVESEQGRGAKFAFTLPGGVLETGRN